MIVLQVRGVEADAGGCRHLAGIPQEWCDADQDNQ
jgi:hypothetical protein